MKRILVCEDEDVIRDFVVINLKRAGYDALILTGRCKAHRWLEICQDAQKLSDILGILSLS